MREVHVGDPFHGVHSTLFLLMWHVPVQRNEKKIKPNLILARICPSLKASHSSLQAGAWSLMPTFTAFSSVTMSSLTSTPSSFTAFQTTMRSLILHWRTSQWVYRGLVLELVLLESVPGLLGICWILRRGFFPFGENQGNPVRRSGFIIRVFALLIGVKAFLWNKLSFYTLELGCEWNGPGTGQWIPSCRPALCYFWQDVTGVAKVFHLEALVCDLCQESLYFKGSV